MSNMPETTENEETTPEDEAIAAANDTDDVPEDDAADVAASDAEQSEEAPEAAEAEDDTPKTPEEQIAALEAEVGSLNDRLLRAMAETENIRRRAQRDKQDTARYAVANFARDMLSVADNLGRALGSVEEEARKESGVIENLMVGVEMTERELMAVMERMGVVRMEPLGTRFDPNVHEAMFEYDDPSQPAGSIGQVIEPGYMIHERPLRPAKVGITKGGPKAEAAPAASADAEGDAGGDSGGATAYESSGDAPGGQLDEEL